MIVATTAPAVAPAAFVLVAAPAEVSRTIDLPFAGVLADDYEAMGDDAHWAAMAEESAAYDGYMAGQYD